MAVGLSSSIVAQLLDALLNSVAFDGPAQIFAKLHVGDPGSAGSSNPATNTTRQEVTFGAASGGGIANDADIVWLAVPAGEDFTHVSLWDHVSAGNFLGSGVVTATAVSASDNFTIQAGELDVVIAPVAA